MTPITKLGKQVQKPEVMPVSTYCGEHYDARQGWKDL